jgi:hypothetical protein
MTGDTTWHADPALLAGYAAGELTRSRAASVEAHLVTCASCRTGVAALVDGERLARNLAAIDDRVDVARLHPVERLLGRLGVPEHVTRILLVAPSARVAWLTGVVAALVVAAVADRASTDATTFVFLVTAPLLPLAGVTTAFATRTDPLHELIVAAPTSTFELSLLRAVSVLAPTIAIGALGAALVPQHEWEWVLWLVPSLGLTATTLALGSWFPVRAVAWALGGVWVAAAAVSVRGAPSTELVERYAAFRPAGQLVLCAVALVAGAVVVVRREAFELAELGRAS